MSSIALGQHKGFDKSAALHAIEMYVPQKSIVTASMLVCRLDQCSLVHLVIFFLREQTLVLQLKSRLFFNTLVRHFNSKTLDAFCEKVKIISEHVREFNGFDRHYCIKHKCNHL